MKTKKAVFYILFFFLIVSITVSVSAEAEIDFLGSGGEDAGSQNIFSVDFIAHDGIFRNPFSDFRSRAEIEEPVEREWDPAEIPFRLKGIISYAGRSTALLSGAEGDRIASEGDIINGYRLTGIFPDAEMISLYYREETIRMRIGGDILDRQ